MRLLLFGLLLLLTGCDTDRVVPSDSATPTDDTSTEVGRFEDEDDYRQQRAATAEALDAAITPATASSVDACRVVPTSEQACGGPTSFAVYSAERPTAAEVERLAARLVALDSVAIRQFQYVSTCMAYTPPTPVLRDGACVSDRE